MADIATNDVYKIQIICRQGGQNGVNVKLLKIKAQSAGPTSQIAFLDGICVQLSALYQNLISSQAVYRGMTMQLLGVVGTIVIVSTNGAGAGIALGDPLPPQTAGLIILKSIAPRRKNIGRVYVPFPTEGDSAGAGSPTAGYVANLDTLKNQFVGTRSIVLALNTIQYEWTTVPKVYNPAVFNPFVQGLSRAFWGTQRRRSYLNRSDLIIV